MPEVLRFPSSGAQCTATFFRADGPGPRPCIVMAHGFGATRAMGLEPFATRFRDAGFHVLSFDYRYFGDSEGEPRQLLDIPSQLADWAAALAFVRSLAAVDGARVALWGSSFSGGHVVVAGARDGRVAAITAQCPMMDGVAALRQLASYAGPRQLASALRHGMQDALGARLGRPPHRIPIVGPPGSLAAMTAEDAQAGYERIAGPDFRNEVCARIALHVGTYRPVRHAARLPRPILVQVCEHDSVAPPSAALEAARRAGARATLVRYPLGHFDVYVGEGFERSCSDQVAFFRRHLAVGG